MKKLILTLSLTLGLPALLMAQSSNYQHEEAIATDTAAPEYVPVDRSKTMEARATEVASSVKGSAGFQFKNPVIFMETAYRASEDHQSFGMDISQSRTDVGFDFDLYDGWIVGAMYTFDYRSGAGQTPLAAGARIRNFQEYVGNTMGVYTAKKFGEWFLCGAAFSYSFIDDQLSSRTIPAAGAAFGSGNIGFDRDSFGASPFVGVSHGWGAWNAATTITYTYGADWYDRQSANGATGLPARPSYTLESHTIIYALRAAYTFNDQWTLGGNFGYTALVGREFAPAAATVASTRDNDYFTVGLKATYHIDTAWTLTGGVETTLDRNKYDDILGKLGFSYGF